MKFVILSLRPSAELEFNIHCITKLRFYPGIRIFHLSTLLTCPNDPRVIISILNSDVSAISRFVLVFFDLFTFYEKKLRENI